MDTPSSTQSREELEKRLQHMKKKYARMQKKLQKSVKQNKVKAHVQKKIAEQALLPGWNSPVNSSAGIRDVIGEDQPGSLHIGPLKLDDSITEHSEDETMVQLTRKRASSSSARSKKRRSVSFVLTEDNHKPNDDSLPKPQGKGRGVEDKHDISCREPAVVSSTGKEQMAIDEKATTGHSPVAEIHKVSSTGEEQAASIEQSSALDEKSTTGYSPVTESHKVSSTGEEQTAGIEQISAIDEKATSGYSPVAESQENLINSSENVMCVEETQDLSQLLATRLVYNRDTIDVKQKSDEICHIADRSKSEASSNTSDKTKEVILPVRASIIATSQENNNHNNRVPTEPNALDTQPSDSLDQSERYQFQTFSDPGPKTTRNKRRRTRRCRELRASDISMKKVAENSQSSQEGNHTWIEGLIYPVEYYVRKTRSMTDSSSPMTPSEHLMPKRLDVPVEGVKKIGAKNRRRSMQDLVASSGHVPSTLQTYNSDIAGVTDRLIDTVGVNETYSHELPTPKPTFPNKCRTNIDNDINKSLNSQCQNTSNRQLSQRNSTDKSSQNPHLDFDNKSQTSSQSSSNSNSSRNSGRRTLSLSRRRHGMQNGSSQKSKLKQNPFDKDVNQQEILEVSVIEDSQKEHTCNSEEPATSNRTIIPGLSEELRNHILSQTTDFILPDSDFVELKLTKAKMAMTCQSPLPITSYDDDAEGIIGLTEPPTVQRNVSLADLTLSERLSYQNEQCFDRLANVNVKDISQGVHSSSNSLETSQTSHSQLSLAKNGKSAAHTTGTKSSTKSENNTGICPNTNLEVMKLHESKIDDHQACPKKPACEGVLESQFTQSQTLSTSTTVFPNVVCRPGASPTEVTMGAIQDEVVLPLDLPPTRTMSFSPHSDNSALVSDVERNIPSHSIQDAGSNGMLLSEGFTSRRSAQPANINIAPCIEVSPSEDGVTTPPMTGSRNVAQASPFADVATATPYGKAEMPNCQSQCDPSSLDEEENLDEDEMVACEMLAGMKYAGCMENDLPSAIIGMFSGNVIISEDDDDKSKQVAFVLVYSVDILVLWMTNDDAQWQIQASWAVKLNEEISCIDILPCCEKNVISLAIGGTFQQCCARFLRYNFLTREHQQLDLCLASTEQHKDKPLHHRVSPHIIDVCMVSPHSVLVQTEAETHYHVYKFDIAYDLSKATCHEMHTSVLGPLSLQRVSDVEDMILMTCKDEILLWDIINGCILQRFNLLTKSKNISTTCLCVRVQSGVLFAVLGIKPTDYKVNSNSRLPLCILMALNPATGKSAILHQYEIPGTGQDSQTWFSDGVVVQSKVAAQTSDGEILIWDLYTAKPMAKIVCPAEIRDVFKWTLTQEGGLLMSLGSCVHVHS